MALPQQVLILCWVLGAWDGAVILAKNHEFKFNKSHFNGEVTLRDMTVDHVANGRAGQLSKAVDTIFGEEPCNFESLNLSSSCLADLNFIKKTWLTLSDCADDRSCTDRHEWVRSVLDAQGRRPPGLEWGNRYWLGAYHQCYDIGIPGKQTPKSDSFNRYCLATIPRKADEDLLFGICAPRSCSSREMHALVSKFANYKTFTVECQRGGNFLDDLSAVIAVSVFLGFALLLIAATCYEFQLLRKYKDDPEQKVQSTKTVLIRGLHKCGLQNNCYVQILTSFSCLTNFVKLFSTKRSQGQIDCMHGIRVISLLYVILYHTVFVIRVIDNPVAIWSIHGIAKAVTSAGAAPVDTFFLASGLSLSYNWFKEMKKPGSAKEIRSGIYWCKFYIYRYIRLTVPYAMVIWYNSEIFRYTGSGPTWPTESHYCSGTWWHNLLYINNYYESSCMLWTWYLAVDFQLYVLSPLILVLLFTFPKTAFTLCSALVAACMVMRGYVYAINDYPPNALPGFLKYGGFTRFWESQYNVYMLTQYRYIPYVIGVLMGYVLIDLKKVKRAGKTIRYLCWISTTIYFFAHIFIPYLFDHLPPLANAAYSGLSRTTWSLMVAWVIYECATGSASYVNKFLSWSGWLPLSRLSYCAFLVHGIVYIFMRDSVDQPYHFESFLSTVYVFFICCVITFLLATTVALAFEMPALELNKLFLKRPTKKHGGVFMKVDAKNSVAVQV